MDFVVDNKKNYCTIYLVRHGETDWNAKGLVQGQSNIPLNKRGEQQAKDLANKLKKIRFAAVFSSDLLRAKKTAEIIALEKNIAIITTQVLRERYFGPLEGKSNPWLKIWQSKLKKSLKQLIAEEEKIFKASPKIENDDRLLNRFIPFLREVAVAYPNKKILMVTHGVVLRAFLKKIGFFKNSADSFNASIKNCAYIKLETDGVDFFIKETEGIIYNK